MGNNGRGCNNGAGSGFCVRCRVRRGGGGSAVVDRSRLRNTIISSGLCAAGISPPVPAELGGNIYLSLRHRNEVGQIESGIRYFVERREPRPASCWSGPVTRLA